MTTKAAGPRAVVVAGMGETCPPGKAPTVVGNGQTAQVCIANKNGGAVLKQLPKGGCKRDETLTQVSRLTYASAPIRGAKGASAKTYPAGTVLEAPVGHYAGGITIDHTTGAAVQLDPTTATGLKEYGTGTFAGFFSDNTCTTAAYPADKLMSTPMLMWDPSAALPAGVTAPTTPAGLAINGWAVTATITNHTVITNAQLYVNVGGGPNTCQAYPGNNILSLQVPVTGIAVTPVPTPLPFAVPVAYPLQVKVN